MKNTLKSVAVLTVIAVICAGLLTVANYFWKVEEPQGVTAELLAVFREMVDDDSAEFYELEIGGIGLNEKVKNAYKASAGNNQDIVILNAEGVAGSYGTVEMLTAINTSDDKIISIRVKSNDTDREQGLRDLNAFKDLDNQTLQNTQFDVISNATVTGNAMIDAVKLAMEQYSAKKQEILSAPAKVYDLLSVNIYLSKDIEEIEAGEALDIIIEITSSNIKKANPNKVAVDITMKRDGRGFSSFKSEKAIEGNKVIYTVKLSRTAASSYEVEVKAKIKDTTVTDSLSFEIKSRIELEVISRMFEGVTQVTEIERDAQTGAVLYTTNLENYVYGYKGYDYEFGACNIFIAFDQDGKIEKIDGVVTNTYDFPVSDYLKKFVGKDATMLANTPRKDAGFDVEGGVTYTSNAVYETVAKICQFYLAGDQ